MEFISSEKRTGESIHRNVEYPVNALEYHHSESGIMAFILTLFIFPLTNDI